MGINEKLKKLEQAAAHRGDKGALILEPCAGGYVDQFGGKYASVEDAAKIAGVVIVDSI